MIRTRQQAARPFTAVPRERLLHFYQQMWSIRLFEEQVDHLFALGKIHGTTHLCIGQEASAVGAVGALEPADYITSTHRGHGHCIAKGADLDRMMAELMGRATGYCHGKGGSMHIADIEAGNLGANGVVGGGIPIATGAALALHMQNRPQVVLCFFGDGATSEGSFHESLNLASVWKLPVVFVCENNQYGMSGPAHKMVSVADVAQRAAAYSMPGSSLDGNDLPAVYDAVSAAVAQARAGGGPSLVECKTYRIKGHSKSDANRYRSREEIDDWRRRDPIPRFRSYLTEVVAVAPTELDTAEQEARRAVEAAVGFAEASPDPDPAALLTDIYAD